MGWLDLSNVSNIFRQSYVNGFLDVSRTLIVRGDASMNGNLFVAGNLNSVTPSSNDNTTRVATTEFVKNQSYSTLSYVDSSLNTLRTYADSSLNLKATIESPTFTGIATIPTANITTLNTTGDASLNGRVNIGKDLTVNGRLNVQNYTNQNIINTTTTNYQLIVSEDLSLNGRLVTSGDVSLNGNLYISNLNGNVQTVISNLITKTTFIDTDVNNQIVISSNIIPSSANSISLGSATMPFKSLYINTNTLYFTSDNTQASLSYNSDSGALDISSGNTKTTTAALAYVDSSLNTLKSYADNSLNLKATIESPIFTGIATIPTANITHLSGLNDSSFNGNLYVAGNITTITQSTSDNSTKAATTAYIRNLLDASLNNYYTKTAVDASINTSYYNKVAIDASINTSYYNKAAIDANLATYYTKTAIDASINTSYYNKAAIDTSLSNYYTKTAVDASINASYYNKAAIDASVNSALVLKSNIASPIFTGTAVIPTANITTLNTFGDSSMNGSVNIGKDLTVNGRLNVQNYTNQNIINTTTTNYQLIVSEDLSLNGRFVVSSDSSFNGNLYVAGTFTAGSYAANSIPSTAIIGGVATSSSTGDFTTNGNLIVKFDASLNGRLFIAGDSSLNGNLYVAGNIGTITQSTSDNSTKVATTAYSRNLLDASLSNYYTKTAIDASINTSYYNKDAIDASINASYYNKSAIDANLATYYTKTAIDASINTSYYNKTAIDASINTSYYNKTDIDTNLGNYYTKTAIDASINTSYYNKAAIDTSVNTALALKANIASPTFTGTAVIPTANITTLNTFGDASMNGNLVLGKNLIVSGTIAAGSYSANSIPASAIIGGVSTGAITSASGDFTTYGNLIVNFDTSLNSRLVVSGDSSFNGNLYVGGTLSYDNLSVNNNFSTLTVEHLSPFDYTIDENLFVLETAVATGTNPTLNSTNVLYSAIDCSFSGRLNVGSDLTINNRLFTNGDASLNGNLSLGKDLTIKGRLNVQNYTNTNIINTTVNNYQLIVSEDLSLNGRLVVSGGDSSFNGNVNVSGTIVQKGGYVMRSRNITTNTTLGPDDYGSVIFPNNNTLTLTLPPASTVGKITVIGTDSNTTIDGAGGDQIRLLGATTGVTFPIYEYNSIYLLGASKYVLVSDGNNTWNVISMYCDHMIDTANTTSRIYGYPPIVFIDSTVDIIYLPSKPYTGQIITIRKTGTSAFTTVVKVTNEHGFSGSILNTTTSGDFTMSTGIYAATFAIRSANNNVQTWCVISTH